MLVNQQRIAKFTHFYHFIPIEILERIFLSLWFRFYFETVIRVEEDEIAALSDPRKPFKVLLTVIHIIRNETFQITGMRNKPMLLDQLNGSAVLFDNGIVQYVEEIRIIGTKIFLLPKIRNTSSVIACIYLCQNLADRCFQSDC